MSFDHLRKPLALAAVLSSAIAGAATTAPGASAVNPGGVPARSPLAVADGTNQIALTGGGMLTAPTNVTSIAFSPKGDRYAYIAADSSVHTVNRDGSGDTLIAAATGVQRLHPTWGDEGYTVGWSELSGVGNSSVLRVTAADGSALGASQPTWAPTGYTASTNPGTASNDIQPEFSGDLLVFERDIPNNGPGPRSILLRGYDASGNPFQKQIAGSTTTVAGSAWDPTISPDGRTVAFLQNVNLSPGVDVPAIFTVDVQPDGTAGTPRQITFPQVSGFVPPQHPTFSPDGKTIAFSSAPGAPQPGTYTVSATVATPGVNPPTKVGDRFGSAAYDTASVGFVHRLAGHDRFDTADQASQSLWRNHGDAQDPRAQASVAVLSRSDLFADALGGSALAAHKGGPLLLTSTKQLDASTARELTRILAPGSKVYLLGGDSAISPAVEASVRHLGFNVDRIGGSDRYSTAVQVAQTASPNPRNILLATGNNYPDALSAGAAAGSDPDSVVVLTNDTTMPAPTRAYLQRYASQLQQQTGSVTAWAVGGQALGAYDTLPGVWYRVDVHGADRYATSLKLANEFFGSRQAAIGIATGVNFPDALSGGALMGAVEGPLLLVNPAVGLSPADSAYLSQSHDTLSDAFVFGGYNALSKLVDAQAGPQVAGAAGWLEVNGAGQVVSAAGAAAGAAASAAAAEAAGVKPAHATDTAHGPVKPHGNAQPSH